MYPYVDSPAATSPYQQPVLDSSTATGVEGGEDLRSPRSIREERALHYAMARFAEMEQSNNTTPATSPREKSGISEDRVVRKEGPFPLELLNNPIKKKSPRSTTSTKRPLDNENEEGQQGKTKRGRKRVKSSKL